MGGASLVPRPVVQIKFTILRHHNGERVGAYLELLIRGTDSLDLHPELDNIGQQLGLKYGTDQWRGNPVRLGAHSVSKESGRLSCRPVTFAESTRRGAGSGTGRCGVP